MLVNPPGVVTVAVGLAGTELPLVAVHTTLPPVLGLGTQVVPGTLSVLPVATLLQVTTVLAVWLDGLGLDVQVGAVGAPVCVKLTGAVLVLPAVSVEVIVGLLDKLAPVPVHVTVNVDVVATGWLLEPDVAKDPLHPPDAAQDVALVELQLRVTGPLVCTSVADALKVTVGAGVGGGGPPPPPPPQPYNVRIAARMASDR